MFFDSIEYIFLFLPIFLTFYFFLNKRSFKLSKLWLAACNIFFYSINDIKHLIFIIFSIIFNFFIAKILNYFNETKSKKKLIVSIGLIFNISFLIYFKYTNFIINSLNIKIISKVKNIVPPLAISFFTFHQILYLIDNYNNVIKEQNFLDYLIFITFFPSMIMGPITHYNDIIDNIKTNKCSSINDRNLFFGISFFIIGLMKKVIIANSLSFWVINGFDVAKNLNIFETWLLSLCYTFQIYFDFSGYSDMATGSALMFNVKLPVNFNSPYKSTNIQEFWHRWHMTLSNFWQSYIYIPLGDSRKGEIRTILNILIVFLVSGIWHGAGSTYIVWGLTHGIAMTFYRIWKKSNIKINKFFGNMITFIFINITWIFFRSDKLKKALKIIETMFNFRSIKKQKNLKI